MLVLIVHTHVLPVESLICRKCNDVPNLLIKLNRPNHMSISIEEIDQFLGCVVMMCQKLPLLILELIELHLLADFVPSALLALFC